MSYINPNSDAVPAYATDYTQAFYQDASDTIQFAHRRPSIFSGLLWAVSLGICFWLAVAALIAAL